MRRPGASVRSRAGCLLVVLLLAGCGADRGPPPGREPRPAVTRGFTVRGRWPGTPTLSCAFEDTGSPLPAGALERAATRALEAWAAAGGPAWRRARPGENPDFTFAWREPVHTGCPPFIAADDGLAHAGPIGSGTFVHVNRQSPFTPDGATGPGLFQVLLHEVGHLHGLDHADDPDAVMWHAYRAGHQTLSGTDVAGIRSLYGDAMPAAPGDLELVTIDASGRPGPPAAVLRSVWSPEDRIAVIDTDGDGRCELLLWPADGGRLSIYSFGAGIALSRTVGPIEGTPSPGVDAMIGLTAEGDRLLVEALPDGRYAALAFDASGLPRVPYPAGPLVMPGLLADRDGNGSLDAPPRATDAAPRPSDLPAPGRIVATGDLERTGRAALLVEIQPGPVSSWRWYVPRPGGTWQASPVLCGRAVAVGDLDGDGRPDLVRAP